MDLLDGEAVARLLAERDLLGLGCLAGAWPLIWLATAVSLLIGLSGEGWGWFGLSLTAMGLERKMGRQSAAMSASRAALMATEMDGAWLGALVEALAWPDRRVRDFARLRLA